jgi:hypothetical protein
MAGAGAGTSTAPNAAINTPASGNVLSCLRVKLCKRIANTVDPVPTNLAFFSETGTAPGGFTRATTLDGQTLRVAGALAALSTTTTAAHTPTSSSASFVVASATGIAVGRTLKIQSGANVYYGVVTAVAGTTITVDTLNFQGDVVGVSYASGAAVTSPATTAGTAETWPTHSHLGAVPSHQHNETHSHAAGPSVNIGGVGPETVWTADTPISIGTWVVSEVGHAHEVIVQVPNASTQTGAAAGGTISGASAATPDTIALAFHKALAGTTQVATNLGGFVDGAICPPGWTEYTPAARRLLKGAAAGAGLAVASGAHSHAVTFNQHAVSHNHGGSVTGMETTNTNSHYGAPYGGGDQDASGGGRAGYPGNNPQVHEHPTTLTGVSTFAGMLESVAGASSEVAGETNMPPSYALRFCVKG